MSVSAPAPATPATASVLDFVYYDARRVGSLLSQLTGNGVLQGLKQTTQAGSTAKLDNQMSGKLSIAVTGGSMAHTETTTSEQRDATERSYDPFWANARDLLDLLDEQTLLHRDLASAAIGQTVLVRGSLLMLDIAALREMWKKPAIRKLVAANAARPGNRRDRRAAGGAPPEAEVALDLIDLLPHVVQGWIVQPDAEVFFTVQPEALVTSPGDLLLKHGIHLGRGWQVLGILDAVPGAITDEEVTDMVRVGAASQLGQLVTNMALPVRDLMGRPPSAYALTPLAIFREVIRAPTPP